MKRFFCTFLLSLLATAVSFAKPEPAFMYQFFIPQSEHGTVIVKLNGVELQDNYAFDSFDAPEVYNTLEITIIPDEGYYGVFNNHVYYSSSTITVNTEDLVVDLTDEVDMSGTSYYRVNVDVAFSTESEWNEDNASTTLYDIDIDGIIYFLDTKTSLAQVANLNDEWRDPEATEYTELNIPSVVVYNNTPYIVASVRSEALYFCENLNTVSMPNTITSIEENAFNGCSSLISITIPNSVTSIGDGAFSGCSSLTSVTIGNSVTNIGDAAFSGCSSLTEIYFLNPEPATLGSNVFKDVDTSNCTVHILPEAKEDYSAVLDGFTNVIEDVEDPESGENGSEPGDGVDEFQDAECDCGCNCSEKLKNLQNELQTQQDTIDALIKRLEALENHTCGDMNGDGIVTVGDVNMVVKKALEQK